MQIETRTIATSNIICGLQNRRRLLLRYHSQLLPLQTLGYFGLEALILLLLVTTVHIRITSHSKLNAKNIKAQTDLPSFLKKICTFLGTSLEQLYSELSDNRGPGWQHHVGQIHLCRTALQSPYRHNSPFTLVLCFIPHRSHCRCRQSYCGASQ